MRSIGKFGVGMTCRARIASNGTVLGIGVSAFLLLFLLVGQLLPFISAEKGPDERPLASWVKTSNGLPASGTYYGVISADLNKDGLLDIVAAGDGSGLRLYRGDGTGNWTAWTAIATTGGYSDVCVGDFDSDGNPDIFAGSPGEGTSTPKGLHLFKGNGAGAFTDVTSGSGLPTTSNWRGVAVGDVNKDGKLDLASTNGWYTSLGVHAFTGNGAGVFTDNSSGLPVADEVASGTVMADFNNDHNLDVTGGWDTTGVYLGNGGGGGAMSWSPSSTGLPSGGHFTGMDATDFNNDGSLDLVISSYSGNGVSAYRNVNGATSWSNSSTGLPFSGGYMDIVAADFNGDGNPDLAFGGYSPGGSTGIHVFTGNGAGSWSESSSGLPTGNSYAGGAVGDFDNDGRPDLMFGRQDGGGIDVYRNIQPVGQSTPRVTLTDPADAETGVPIDANIAITFSTAMDQSAAVGAISSSPAITGSFIWDVTSKTVTIAPSMNLQPNTKYVVTISIAAKGQGGVHILCHYTYSFTTSPSAPEISPLVLMIVPLIAIAWFWRNSHKRKR